jgi:hypothetical protein
MSMLGGVMSMLARSNASVIARTLVSARITGPGRSRPSFVALALGVLIVLAACTGSRTTLALPPDFLMRTPAGIASVSIRESLPGMTDHEFEQTVKAGMERAAPGAVLADPVDPPFPPFRIVWHVNPYGYHASNLVVNIFNVSVPFAYDQAVVDNSASPAAIMHTVESMTRRLINFHPAPKAAT